MSYRTISSPIVLVNELKEMAEEPDYRFQDRYLLLINAFQWFTSAWPSQYQVEK